MRTLSLLALMITTGCVSAPQGECLEWEPRIQTVKKIEHMRGTGVTIVTEEQVAAPFCTLYQ